LCAERGAIIGPSTVIMNRPADRAYVSRGGEKLAAALDAFAIDPHDQVCADLGCNVGGFTDCLLRRGALRVHAVDTGYGELAWTLRRDPRVVVRERTNALHVELPEPVALVTIDVAWTRQHLILPAAARMLAAGGSIVTLIKPHYEAERKALRQGVLPADAVDSVLELMRARVAEAGLGFSKIIPSPIRGRKGNRELLGWVIPNG
jgi:23S rRNA (cytidine1920-2'-O)/16S rRNA (cytidine1409-2'-O)-methyltransferase